jgi:hypothetical protein
MTDLLFRLTKKENRQQPSAVQQQRLGFTMVDTVPISTFQTQASKRMSSSQASPAGQSNPNDMPAKSPMVIHANGTTNGNNKTDSYSYSYTYKKAAEDTGTGMYQHSNLGHRTSHGIDLFTSSISKAYQA